MNILGVITEDFVNYKKPCMVIEFPKCTFKCDRECGRSVCQNSALAALNEIAISSDKITDMYVSNPISEAIVMQGLEPFDSFDDLSDLIRSLRKKTNDDIVIYTGYNEDEVEDYIIDLKRYKNIIIKFGRYIPNQQPHFDPILGVKLASNNQYAKVIRGSE